MPIPIYPADKVRPLRVKLKMTQQEFADGIGVARSLVAHWETGRAVPTGPAAILLSQYEARQALPEKSLISA